MLPYAILQKGRRFLSADQVHRLKTYILSQPQTTVHDGGTSCPAALIRTDAFVMVCDHFHVGPLSAYQRFVARCGERVHADVLTSDSAAVRWFVGQILALTAPAANLPDGMGKEERAVASVTDPLATILPLELNVAVDVVSVVAYLQSWPQPLGSEAESMLRGLFESCVGVRPEDEESSHESSPVATARPAAFPMVSSDVTTVSWVVLQERISHFCSQKLPALGGTGTEEADVDGLSELLLKALGTPLSASIPNNNNTVLSASSSTTASPQAAPPLPQRMVLAPNKGTVTFSEFMEHLRDFAFADDKLRRRWSRRFTATMRRASFALLEEAGSSSMSPQRGTASTASSPEVPPRNGRGAEDQSWLLHREDTRPEIDASFAPLTGAEMQRAQLGLFGCGQHDADANLEEDSDASDFDADWTMSATPQPMVFWMESSGMGGKAVEPTSVMVDTSISPPPAQPQPHHLHPDELTTTRIGRRGPGVGLIQVVPPQHPRTASAGPAEAATPVLDDASLRRSIMLTPSDSALPPGKVVGPGGKQRSSHGGRRKSRATATDLLLEKVQRTAAAATAARAAVEEKVRRCDAQVKDGLMVMLPNGDVRAPVPKLGSRPSSASLCRSSSSLSAVAPTSTTTKAYAPSMVHRTEVAMRQLLESYHVDDQQNAIAQQRKRQAADDKRKVREFVSRSRLEAQRQREVETAASHGVVACENRLVEAVAMAALAPSGTSASRRKCDRRLLELRAAIGPSNQQCRVSMNSDDDSTNWLVESSLSLSRRPVTACSTVNPPKSEAPTGTYELYVTTKNRIGNFTCTVEDVFSLADLFEALDDEIAAFRVPQMHRSGRNSIVPTQRQPLRYVSDVFVQTFEASSRPVPSSAAHFIPLVSMDDLPSKAHILVLLK